jgi:pilus assembly protein Flp/PilA
VIDQILQLTETGMKTLRKMVKDNKGATAIEYGLIAALIAVAAIGAMSSLGTQLNTTFGNISSKLRTNS